MESEEERITRQGQFATELLERPEWVELLRDVREQVVDEWTRSASVEARETAYAKIVALGVTHALLGKWKDRKDVQDMQADQEQGTSAL